MPMQRLDLVQLLTGTDKQDLAKRIALGDISISIAKSKRVVVVSGAGISCSSGIPDFRSEDGLYSLVKARYPDAFVTGRDLFSSQLFMQPQTCALFYTFIAELYFLCQEAIPTPTHHFIKKLNDKNKLLRSYTQNIDGIERRIGLESGGRGKGLTKTMTKNVELHGDLGRVRCVLCMKDYNAECEWMELFREGKAPGCPACSTRCEDRMTRSARATPIGSLRPSIVLYDEPHPLSEDIGSLQLYDLAKQPEVLLIMGTSLKVHGLKRLVKEFAKVIHAPGGTKKAGIVVFVNKTPPPAGEWDSVIDYWVEGETDAWVQKVEKDWRHIRPVDWERQSVLDTTTLVKPKGPKGLKKAKVCEKGAAYSLPSLPTPERPLKEQIFGSDLSEYDYDTEDWSPLKASKAPSSKTSSYETILPSSSTKSSPKQLPTPSPTPELSSSPDSASPSLDRNVRRSASMSKLALITPPLSPAKRRGNIPTEPQPSPTKKFKVYTLGASKAVVSIPAPTLCSRKFVISPASQPPPAKRQLRRTQSEAVKAAGF